MKKYKVLTKDLKSPFQNFQYEMNKEYICEDFDESSQECSNGFYATDVEGLIYCINSRKGNKVFEVEVNGKSKVFNQFKQRFEKQTIIREVPENEVKALILEENKNLKYDLYHSMYPINPLIGEPKEATDDVIELLNKWISVMDSVWNSVYNSVRNSVRNSVMDSAMDSVMDSVYNSVWNSLRDSVRYSVGNSVYAYIGSLFPEVKNWKYIEHEEGVYPFQPAVDLWKLGFAPSFDGKIWRLHSGKDAEIVYEQSII